jgi:C1A family cysteine protease
LIVPDNLDQIARAQEPIANKNSWGTYWGETCGQGSQKGYMYIKYGTHNIGRLACWIKAKPVF